MAKKCSRCGTDIGFLSTIEVENRKYCVDCSNIVSKELEEVEETRSKITIAQTQGIICTTTPSLEGYKITEYISIINVQVILGVDAWRDMVGSIKSWVGGRSKGLESELRDGFMLANDELKKEAYLLNANAVVGVEFDGGMEVAGDAGVNDKMMVVSATGTAVVVTKDSG